MGLLGNKGGYKLPDSIMFLAIEALIKPSMGETEARLLPIRNRLYAKSAIKKRDLAMILIYEKKLV